MKAVCWQGPNKVQVETVPEPKIINPRDAIVKITSTAICGSDLLPAFTFSSLKRFEPL